MNDKSVEFGLGDDPSGSQAVRHMIIKKKNLVWDRMA